jgi:hypothetical protein
VGEYGVYLDVSNLLNKHIKNMSPKPYEFKLDMNFKVDKKSVYHRTLLCEPTFVLQLFGSSDYIDGVFDWALQYSVPKDVPIDKEIELELTIYKDIENFYKLFGNPTIKMKYYMYSYK